MPYFSWVNDVNKEADENPKVLRISIDSKARVKIGDLSRKGKSRGLEPLKASDHDHNWSETLIPFGILNKADSSFAQSRIGKDT